MHMHGEPYLMQQIRRKRERGQRMARARWEKEDRARAALAAADPLTLVRHGRVLIQRVVVIHRDQTVQELCRWSDTSAREWARMKREARL